jgi:hypothetical protein
MLLTRRIKHRSHKDILDLRAGLDSARWTCGATQLSCLLSLNALDAQIFAAQGDESVIWQQKEGASF